jgi:hypothetical protein
MCCCVEQNAHSMRIALQHSSGVCNYDSGSNGTISSQVLVTSSATLVDTLSLLVVTSSTLQRCSSIRVCNMLIQQDQ